MTVIYQSVSVTDDRNYIKTNNHHFKSTVISI